MNKGQSTIEFLISFILIFGMTFAFIRISFSSVNGFLAHYATYMASRVFLVGDRNENSPQTDDQHAIAAARSEFSKYQIQTFIPGSGTPSVRTASDPGDKRFIGVLFSFQQNFSYFVGISKTLNMLTESFLGREPTRGECHQRICDLYDQGGMNCSDDGNSFIMVYDNGC